MKWDDVYGNFKKFADRAAKKINQTADMATLQVKLSMAEKKLNEAFALLGRAAYEHFSGDSDLSERVMLAVEHVNSVKSEIRSLEEQIKEAERRAAESARSSESSFDTAERDATSECSSETGTKNKAEADAATDAQCVQASVPVSAFATDSEDAIEVDVSSTVASADER